MTADVYGNPKMQQIQSPYCLQCDGLWQDTFYHPTTWGCWRFPAWQRGKLNCCWAPITQDVWVRTGVVAEGAPVPTSNGCVGDGIGPADYDDEQRQNLRELWRVASSRRIARVLPERSIESI